MNNLSHEKDILKKIRILMIARLILVTLIMIAGTLVLKAERIPFYYIIAVFYFVTFIYAMLIRFNFPLYANGYLQILIDIVLETVTIHYAGGADSIYAFLYAPSIAASGVIISSRAAKTIAGLSSVFYALISGLEFFGIINPVHRAESIYSEGVYSILFVVSFRIILFCLIGYLSSYLSKELHKKRIELARLQNLSDIVLKSISSGVITVDNSSRIIYANSMAKKILDRTDKEILSAYWPDLILEESNLKNIGGFIAEAKQPEGKEIEIQLLNGKKLVLCFSYADLVDEKNKTIGAVLTFIDLTTLKALEMEICQREKISAMGEMAVAITHEIRNPMASIRGALEVLREKARFQGEDAKLVEVVFKESDRLNNILEDFLKYAKERKPNIKYEDIGHLIDEVWLLVRQDERWHKGISLEKKLNLSQVIIKIDPDRIKQVFYNLFINALEACLGRTEGGKINIDVYSEKEKVKIIVKDNGMGIKKEDMDKVFKRFHSTKPYGLGMGLSITRRIIEFHHGAIALQSEEGKGTTVTIALPK